MKKIFRNVYSFIMQMLMTMFYFSITCNVIAPITVLYAVIKSIIIDFLTICVGYDKPALEELDKQGVELSDITDPEFAYTYITNLEVRLSLMHWVYKYLTLLGITTYLALLYQRHCFILAFGKEIYDEYSNPLKIKV